LTINSRYGYAKEFARQALLNELARLEFHLSDKARSNLAAIEAHKPRGKMCHTDLCGLLDLVKASIPDGDLVAAVPAQTGQGGTCH
jgi:hypothetical protein